VAVNRRPFRPDDPGQQGDVGVGEGHAVASGEQDLARLPDLGAAPGAGDRVHGVRSVAFQPEDHGVGRAVAGTGRAEGTVKLHPHAGDPLERAGAVEEVGERRRRAHRADRVRARRSDADRE
jgi:hypothetical protein